jgi:hypothetical protein
MNKSVATLASAALLGALAGASGCVENRASVQTQAICIPTKDCAFAETCDAQYIGYLALDKGTSPNDVLWITVQVANQMPNNEDLSVGRVNTNDAHIDETVIEYEGALGGEQAVGSNFLVPAAGTAVVSAKMSLAAAAAGEVLAHLRFRGYLDDGTRFETGDFPITVVVTTSGGVSAACGGGPTCPPDSEGQLPLTCIQ